jgi:hypothetical protein
MLCQPLGQRQDSNLQLPLARRFTVDVSVPCATGSNVSRLWYARGLVLVSVDIGLDAHRLNRGYRLKAARLGRNTERLDLDRQLLHFVPGRLTLVAEFAAIEDNKWHDNIWTGVGADHQQIGLSVTGHEMSPVAALAQVRVADRSSIFDIQFAHGVHF